MVSISERVCARENDAAGARRLAPGQQKVSRSFVALERTASGCVRFGELL